MKLTESRLRRIIREEAQKLNEGLKFDDIKVGYQVTIKTPQGQTQSGKATIWNPKYKIWVLNTGGKHGTTTSASAKNTIKVVKGKAPKGAGIFGKRSWDESAIPPKKGRKRPHMQKSRSSLVGLNETAFKEGDTVTLDRAKWKKYAAGQPPQYVKLVNSEVKKGHGKLEIHSTTKLDAQVYAAETHNYLLGTLRVPLDVLKKG